MIRLNQASQKGFTIIELLVVIVILGILVTVVTVAYNGIQGSTRDKAVLSDLDALDGIETDYGIKNSVAGKAWYSGSGSDSDINFTPTSGNVIDIVVNGTDYCIRGYNPSSSTYKTLATAATKASSTSACSTISPSSLALADSSGGFVTVSTLAGSSYGYLDGTGISTQFEYPNGLVVSSGYLYAADGSHTIRKISTSGIVTTLAGSADDAGFNDATGTSAQFAYMYGIAKDSSGNLYVADSDNNRIRKITLAGVVTTFAGSGTSGNSEGTGTSAQFASPRGVTVDSSDNVYVADTNNCRIRKITSAGVVTTLAGSSCGYAEGTGSAAQFNYPYDVAVDSTGNVFVADSSNKRIRKITPGGVVTTLAGSGSAGYADGTGSSAVFSAFVGGLAVDTSDNIYVADTVGYRIRKVTQAGVVTTVAGSGESDFLDGIGISAKFMQPEDVTVGATGVLYVADENRIRKIQL